MMPGGSGSGSEALAQAAARLADGDAAVGSTPVPSPEGKRAAAVTTASSMPNSKKPTTTDAGAS